MPNPTAMIAMGGNSLSPKGEAGTITRETLDGIDHFIERGYNLCINHGNGAQHDIPQKKQNLWLKNFAGALRNKIRDNGAAWFPRLCRNTSCMESP